MRVPLLLTLALLAGCAAPEASPPERDPVERVDPVEQVERIENPLERTIAVEGEFDELMASAEKLRTLAADLRRELEELLEEYELEDDALRREVGLALLHSDVLEGRFEEILRKLPSVRALSKKRGEQLVGGLPIEAWALANLQLGPGAGANELEDAFLEHLRGLVEVLPRSEVRQELGGRVVKLRMMTPNMFAAVGAVFTPMLHEQGGFNPLTAARVLSLANAKKIQLPVREDMVAIYSSFLAGAPLVDVFAEREVELAADAGLEPTVVAIWDTGVDVDLFEGRLFVNPLDPINGVDDDGNGFVDDRHGPVFGTDFLPSTGWLRETGLSRRRYRKAERYALGLADVENGIDSAAAAAFREHMGELEPDELEAFFADVGLVIYRSHGTHVAGIAAAGNPFIRLLVARKGGDYGAVEGPLKLAHGEIFAAMVRDTVAYFRANDVRVVNMSWDMVSLGGILANLEANGVGSDAEEREALAREIFGVMSSGLSEALASAPEILFVIAAGNTGGDPLRQRWTPPARGTPNLLLVGAVDSAGGLTSFSTYGPDVRLYANGFAVESYLPGGKRARYSGTSMAAPQITNLAAKLLAHAPNLAPKELIALMLSSGEPVELAGRPAVLVHPARALAQLKDR